MLQFFHGWRRKVGVATLGLACALFGMWVRSQFIFETLEIPVGDTAYAYGVISNGGGVDFYRVAGMEPAGEWIYSSRPLAVGESKYSLSVTPWQAHHEIEWRWDWAGFHFGVCRWRKMNWRIEDYMIPYWSLVLPLTLLSAYLILWKPRKQKTSDQPTNPNVNSN